MNQKYVGYVLTGMSIIILLMLTFTKVNVDQEGAYLCKLVEESARPMEECPAHNSNTSWYILGAFFLVSIALAIGVLMIFTPEQENKKEEYKKVDMTKLDAEEQKIIRLLEEKEGSTYQSDLIKETGHSKVKITRTLDKMENKGILEKKRRGMTNIVVLK